jgi:predicted site-specific integrase-resolvase
MLKVESKSNANNMEQILSRKEVAATFGVTSKTVRRWERANVITPVYYQRGRPKYKLSDLEKVVTPKQESFYYKKAQNEAIEH